MHYHFIAIGGAIMHNLALELLALGNHVTGSDDEIFDPAKSRLEKAGILPKKLGWFEENISPKIDVIILGMHARADNLELAKCKNLGLKIYSFPDFIYEHSKNKKRIVIAGSHGKTTCTAMLMHVFKVLNVEVDYLVGSQITGYDRMVRLSNEAEYMVIEGDEYLTSALDPVPKFHKYFPQVAMITGIAWDHINVFPTWEIYLKQFDLFFDMVTEKCFVFKEDTELVKMANSRPLKTDFYNTPNYKENGDKTGVIVGNNTYYLPFFGEHNLQNAQGVQKLAAYAGIDENDFWTALTSFTGSAKRMEIILETNDLTVIRDFAHSPSKAKATVSAVKQRYVNKHIIAVFELHTFSSLQKDFITHYKGVFNGINDAAILFDPHVLELKKMPVLDLDFVANEIGDVVVFDNATKLKNWVELKKTGNKEILLLLMSSGNFGNEVLY